MNAKTLYQTALQSNECADWETAAHALFKVCRKPKKARVPKKYMPLPLYDVLLEDGELFTVPVAHNHPDPETSAGHKARWYWTGRQLQYDIWRGATCATAPSVDRAPAVADVALVDRDAWLARFDPCGLKGQLYKYNRADMQAINKAA